jgi:2-dehydropantoate 2-reductase
VLFVDSDPAKVAWGRSHGVCVDERQPLPADFVSFEEWSPALGDWLLLCTKCYDNPAVLGRVPLDATIIPIQNGFDHCFDSRGVFAEGIASFISECAPRRTHTRITRRGDLHLGVRRKVGTSPNGSTDTGEVVAALASALGHPDLFKIEIVADTLPFKHAKLMYNAAIGPLAAAAGLDNCQLLSIPKVRRLFFMLLRENFAILDGAGVSLGKIGPFHPRTVDQILRHELLARSLSWAFCPALRGTYCSMHADLPNGKTEIEFYNRYLIDLAGDRPCPLNRGVYQLIKSMERDRIPPAIETLECLY